MRVIPLILVLIIGLFACSEERVQPLRVASSPWPGYEPLYLARDLGYLNSKAVKLFELPSSDITMESFRNGSADVATLTLDETLELIHDGTKLRILTVLDISNGGDAVLASSDITSFNDVKGKRISTTNIPLGMYMLSRFLEKAGVSRQDVEVHPMPDTNQLEFYKGGKADIVITYEPVKTKLLEEGMHVIFDSRDIPFEILDLLVVREDVYLTRKNDLCDIGKQWKRSLEYMLEHKQDSSTRISKRMGLHVDRYEEVMSGLIFPGEKEIDELLLGDNSKILLAANKLSSNMLKDGQLERDVDIEPSLTPDFVKCLK
jgi:NitT/TauT family transport system substrate-binding protein